MKSRDQTRHFDSLVVTLKLTMNMCSQACSEGPEEGRGSAPGVRIDLALVVADGLAVDAASLFVAVALQALRAGQALLVAPCHAALH